MKKTELKSLIESIVKEQLDYSLLALDAKEASDKANKTNSPEDHQNAYVAHKKASKSSTRPIDYRHHRDKMNFHKEKINSGTSSSNTITPDYNLSIDSLIKLMTNEFVTNQKFKSIDQTIKWGKAKAPHLDEEDIAMIASIIYEKYKDRWIR